MQVPMKDETLPIEEKLRLLKEHYKNTVKKKLERIYALLQLNCNDLQAHNPRFNVGDITKTAGMITIQEKSEEVGDHLTVSSLGAHCKSDTLYAQRCQDIMANINKSSHDHLTHQTELPNKKQQMLEEDEVEEIMNNIRMSRHNGLLTQKADSTNNTQEISEEVEVSLDVGSLGDNALGLAHKDMVVSPSPPAPCLLPSPDNRGMDNHHTVSYTSLNSDPAREEVVNHETYTISLINTEKESEYIDQAVQDYKDGKYSAMQPLPLPQLSTSPSVADSSASSLKLYFALFNILQRGQRKPKPSVRQHITRGLRKFLCCIKGQSEE